MDYERFARSLRSLKEGLKPTSQETDFFTRRVMSRLQAEPESQPWLDWVFGRWTIPALGTAVAALFLFFARVESEPEDILMMVDARNEYAQELAEPENALSILMEESQ